MKLRASVLALLVAILAALGGTTTASAQPNQSGLINVAIVDNTVQIPIAIAANVCGVSVNVLADALELGDTTCDAVAGATASRSGGGGGGGGRQEGLVNLYVADNVIQVPVGIAANICGVSANVLAVSRQLGDVTCDAVGNADATA